MPRPTSRPASPSPSRRSRCWPHDKVRFAGEPVALVVAESAAQALDAAELVEVDYEPLPAVTSADAARAAGAPLIADEVPGNVCLDWRTGDAAGRRCRLRARRSCRLADARQPSHRHEPDGAARRRRAVRSGERPLHAACLQPEHPHQPRPCRPRARRRARGRALRRARCRRRLRRQELRLCRACAGPVGGQAHRPAGEMDRQPQRGVPGRPRRARHRRPRPRWRSMPRAGSSRCRSPASPISAPT